jgi:hypothetical protein
MIEIVQIQLFDITYLGILREKKEKKYKKIIDGANSDNLFTSI